MNLLKNKTISMFLLTISFSLAVIILAITLYLTIYQARMKERFTDLVEQNNIQIAYSVTSEFSERFTTINTQILTIHNSLETFDHTYSVELDDFFEQQYNNNDIVNMEFRLTDLDGLTVYSYPTNPEELGKDESSQEYFKNVISKDEIYWSKPYRSNISGDEMITISIKGDDHYLFVHMDLEYLDYVYHQVINHENKKELIILDEFGIIIYDSSSINDDLHLPLYDFQKYKAQNTEELFDFDYEKSNYIATKSEVESTNWTIIVFQNKSVVTDFVGFIEKQLIFLNLSVIIVVIIMVSTGSYFFSRRIKSYVIGLDIMSKGDKQIVFNRSKVRLLDNLGRELNETKIKIDSFNRTLKDIAYVDQLTKGLNRESLKSEFTRFKEKGSYNLVMINIKRFSLYNESYGYDFGNNLLINVSSILNNQLSEHSICGRLENDKFLIISSIKPDILIEQIEKAFLKETTINEISVEVNLEYYSIENPNQENDFNDHILNLMQMRQHKSDEYGKVFYFKDDFSNMFKRQIEIELALEKSLINRDFSVAFQPIVMKDNPEKIRGFEALARWTHNQLNMITPDEFIPILERTHKVHRLDYIIIFEAIKMINDLTKNTKKNYVLSCNVSVETILHEGFIDFINDTLKLFKYNPRYFEIEITESTIIRNPKKVIAVINELSSYGIKFSQDDFGDGYSSLNYLTQLNISTLKLSKNLTDGILDGFNNRLLINTVIELAHELGFEVIVEGVESEEVINVLKDFNCDYIQGYYYYKPLTYTKLVEICKNK